MIPEHQCWAAIIAEHRCSAAINAKHRCSRLTENIEYKSQLHVTICPAHVFLAIIVYAMKTRNVCVTLYCEKT